MAITNSQVRRSWLGISAFTAFDEVLVRQQAFHGQQGGTSEQDGCADQGTAQPFAAAGRGRCLGGFQSGQNQ
jgi:hypothetical protein